MRTLLPRGVRGHRGIPGRESIKHEWFNAGQPYHPQVRVQDWRDLLKRESEAKDFLGVVEAQEQWATEMLRRSLPEADRAALTLTIPQTKEFLDDLWEECGFPRPLKAKEKDQDPLVQPSPSTTA